MEGILSFFACAYCLAVAVVTWVWVPPERRAGFDSWGLLVAISGVALLDVVLAVVAGFFIELPNPGLLIGRVALGGLTPVLCYKILSSGDEPLQDRPEEEPEAGHRVSVVMAGVMLLFRLFWLPIDLWFAFELPILFWVVSGGHVLRGVILFHVARHAVGARTMGGVALVSVVLLAAVDGWLGWMLPVRAGIGELANIQVLSSVVLLGYVLSVWRDAAALREQPQEF